jgi:AraC-like DNA-binding protein
MDINNISPYIRVALDSIIPPPWQLNERVIFDYELLYVKEGEINVTIEDEIYYGKPGDIFFIRPKQRHSIHINGNKPLRQPHIHFDFFYKTDSPKVKVSFKPLEQMSESELMLFRDDIADSFGIKFPGKIRIRKVDYFEKMLFDIIYEYNTKLPFYEISVKGLTVKLLTYLMREIYWSDNPTVYSNMEELRDIKEYLDCNFRRVVSLDELVERFNMSKYYLIRHFKRAFGMSPIQYHQLLRIEKVKEMIQYTNQSIGNIAEEFGFDSINAFSRSFKGLEGVPPSYYRKRGKREA